jgi:hypothetical protein
MSDTTPGTGDRDTSQVAREQGQQVKSSAQDAASNVAGTAGEKARDIKDQAGSHARGVVVEARQQVRGRVEQETERAGGALSNAGSQLQALAEGRTDEAGVFGEYAQQAAQVVNRWADSVQDRGLDGLLDDLRSVARRRPGAFLLGAVAAGVIAGRFGRNLREEMSDSDGGSGDNRFSTSREPSFVAGERTAEVEVVGGPARGRRSSTTPPTTPPPPVATPDEPRGPHGDPLRDDIAGERRIGDDIDVPRADAKRGRI